MHLCIVGKNKDPPMTVWYQGIRISRDQADAIFPDLIRTALA